jgi:hypothetical protein
MKIFATDKRGKIISGGLLAAGLSQSNRLDPTLTPLAKIANIIFDQSEEYQEYNLAIIYNLFKLLGTEYKYFSGDGNFIMEISN